MSYRRASQSWKISIFDPFNLSLSSYYWQSVNDFTRCHVDWIIQYVDFSDQLPSLSNVHLDSPMQLYGLIIHYFLSLSSISFGEGNGTPLQNSCLENPRDGGAWQAAVYGVAQSRTRLKQLSSSISLYGCVTVYLFPFKGCLGYV